jgi:uncharacterized protein (TIGR03437 family)
MARAKLSEAYGQLPLSFEANEGQFDARMKFVSHGGSHSLALTQTEAAFALRGGDGGAPFDLRMKFHNANRNARIEGLDPLPGVSNYLIGGDRSKWRTGVANYAKVRYREIYRGIDLVWRGDGRRLKYDLVVAPGAEPRDIELAFVGAEKMRIKADGDLALSAAGVELLHHKPVIYQEVSGEKRMIAGGYARRGKNRVGFRVARYDRNLPLVIDPYVLYFATYLGGSSADNGKAIAADNDGNVYVAGSTASTDFPGPKTLQAQLNGQTDAFVAKINPKGTALLWTTYLGGGGADSANHIALDAAGNILVAGDTYSPDFPLVNPIQRARSGGQDSFAAKLKADGTALLYSTYLGGNGSEFIHKATVDADGALVFAGVTNSTDFPTVNALQAEVAATSAYRSLDGGANWSQLGSGLPMVTINQIAPDPANSATLYAATSGGVFKSVNGGASWSAAGLTRNTYRLAIDPVSPMTLYAATGDPSVRLYKSDDGGATWRDIHNGLGPVYIVDIAVDPKTPTRLFLVAGNKIYRSVDGGNSWMGFDVGLGPDDYLQTIAIDPVNPNRVFAGGQFGVFRSADGGATWGRADNGFKATPVIRQLLFDPANPGALYAAINRFDSYFQRINDAYLYRSVDGGNNWTPADARDTGPIPGVVFELAIDPFSPQTLYALVSPGGGAEIHKRSPGSDRWERIHPATLPGRASSLDFDLKAPGRLYVGFDGASMSDLFVARINPSGSALVYSTYISGARVEGLRAMALDANGNVYLTGYTSSRDFPTTPGSYQPAPANCPYEYAFVTKLKADGRSLAYSTFFGCGTGSEMGVDAAGAAYIATWERLIKLNPEGSEIVYSQPMNHAWYGLKGLSVSPSGRACVAGCIGLPPYNPIGSPTRFECRAVEFDAQGAETTNICLAGGAADARGNFYFLGDPYIHSFFPAPARTTPGVFQPEPRGQGDVYLTRYAPVPGVQTASAANYRPSVATGSLAVLFGSNLSRATQAATTTPLPTELASVRVGVVYGGNTQVLAPLLFVSPSQINFQLPESAEKGTIFVTLDGEPVAANPIEPLAVAPGVFTANSNGRGPAAAYALRVRADGSRRNEPVAQYDPVIRQFVTTPIDLGPETDQVFLVLFGTGWRNRSLTGGVVVTVSGVEAPVTFAGAQPSFAGLDQINALLPRSLMGKGEVDLVVTVDGKTANTVKVSIE